MKPYYQRAGWRWLPGMLAKDSDGVRWRVYAIARHTGYPLAVREGDERVRPECGALVHDAAPVLDDPATQGAALAVLREYAGPDAHFVRLATNVWDGAGGTVPTYWWALSTDVWSDPAPQRDAEGHVSFLAGPTYAAALLAALDHLIPE